jgi:hypothetical protein
MALGHSPKIVMDSLVFYTDPANPKSYPRSGTTTYDLSLTKSTGTTSTGVAVTLENNGIFSRNGAAYVATTDTTSSSNLFKYSEELSNTVWAQSYSGTRSSVIANTAEAPNGTLTADTWVRSNNIAAWMGQIVSKSSNTAIRYTTSIYAKQETGRYFAMRMQGVFPSRADCIFDLQNGEISVSPTVSSNFSGAYAAITPASNGWYRCVLSATSDTHNSIQSIISFNSNNIVIDGNDSSNTSSGFIWGAQLTSPDTGYVVSCGNSAPFTFGTSSFSCGLWIKTKAQVSSSGLGIFGKGTFGTGAWGSYLISTGQIRFELKTPSNVTFPAGINYIANSGVVNDGNWHFVFANYNRNGTLDVYTDGLYTASSISMLPSMSEIISNSSVLGIGGGAPGIFVGSIGACMMYSRLLSPAEIAQNFDALRGRYGI